MTGVNAGNAVLDGEAIGKSWRMTLEIKSGYDDAIRGKGAQRRARRIIQVKLQKAKSIGLSQAFVMFAGFLAIWLEVSTPILG